MKIEIEFTPNRRLLGIFDQAKTLPQNLPPSLIVNTLVRCLLTPFMDIEKVKVKE